MRIPAMIPKNEDPDPSAHAEQPVAAVDPVVALERGERDEPDHRVDDDRTERRTWQALEQCCQEQHRGQDEHGVDQRRQLGLLARTVGDRGLRQAAVDDEAAHEPRCAVRHPLRDELLVRVELVAVLARHAPRGSKRLGVADEDDRQRSDQKIPGGAPPDPTGSPIENRPVGTSPVIATPRSARFRTSTAMIDSVTTIRARGSLGKP